MKVMNDFTSMFSIFWLYWVFLKTISVLWRKCVSPSPFCRSTEWTLNIYWPTEYTSVFTTPVQIISIGCTLYNRHIMYNRHITVCLHCSFADDANSYGNDALLRQNSLKILRTIFAVKSYFGFYVLLILWPHICCKKLLWFLCFIYSLASPV